MSAADELPKLDQLHHELTCAISLLRLVAAGVDDFADTGKIGEVSCAIDSAIGSFVRVREQLEALSYREAPRA